MFEHEEYILPYTEAINKQLEEIRQQFVLAKLNENLNVINRIPALANLTAAPHTYSLEYTERPRTRSISSTSSQQNNLHTRMEVRTRLSPSADEQDNTPQNDDVILTPEQKPAKEADTIKKLYIIHI